MTRAPIFGGGALECCLLQRALAQVNHQHIGKTAVTTEQNFDREPAFADLRDHALDGITCALCCVNVARAKLGEQKVVGAKNLERFPFIPVHIQRL